MVYAYTRGTPLIFNKCAQALQYSILTAFCEPTHIPCRHSYLHGMDLRIRYGVTYKYEFDLYWIPAVILFSQKFVH